MTNAELAILGLVVETPRHGYEIEQVIEERNMRNWTEVGFSSIYYILQKLEKRGLVRSKLQPAAGRGPQRKVFSVTPKGTEAWRTATLAMLSVPSTNAPFILGLAGIPGLSAQEAVSALRQYRREVLRRREELEQEWDRSRQLPVFLQGMYEYGYNLAQTELEWLDRYIPRLESQIME